MESPKLQCSFCLLGPPASGKGTIGSMLYEVLGIPMIMPGDIYRRLREEDSELGHLVRESLKDGGYCPDSLTNKIILEEAKKLAPQGVILDGYPRTMAQFEYLMDNFEVKNWLCFDAPYEDLIHAATNRIQCSSCGKVWSKLMDENKCCSCPDRIWKERFDDSVALYPKRYEVYSELTSPIIRRVEGLSNYKHFQSLGNPEIISEVLYWVQNHSY